MYCNQCGQQIAPEAKVCTFCGRQVAGGASGEQPALHPVAAAPAPGTGYPAAAYYPSRSQTRVARHFKTLGVLWLIYAALSFGESVFLLTMGHWGPWNWPMMHMGPNLIWVPGWMNGMVRIGGFIGLFVSALRAAAGVGLLERASWARIVSIVAAIVTLPRLLLGTLLGIYTLVVMFSDNAEQQWAALSQRSTGTI